MTLSEPLMLSCLMRTWTIWTNFTCRTRWLASSNKINDSSRELSFLSNLEKPEMFFFIFYRGRGHGLAGEFLLFSARPFLQLLVFIMSY